MYIEPQKIRNLLFNEDEYINEFCEEAVKSFNEFSTNYRIFLLNRDETSFRKNGHKMKPVAQMIGADEMVEEYERAKNLLHESADDKALLASATAINEITSRVVEELQLMINTDS